MRTIYAEALKRLVDEEWFDCQEKSSFFDEIDRTPTVDLVKRGEWIAVEYNDGTVRTECSVCGYGRGLPPVRNYCPNCGAKMERSEE